MILGFTSVQTLIENLNLNRRMQPLLLRAPGPCGRSRTAALCVSLGCEGSEFESVSDGKHTVVRLVFRWHNCL